MSFILKALKKLEDEKAARKGGEVDLPGALLRADARPAHGRVQPVRWWIFIIVFAAGSGLTALLVQSRPRTSEAVRAEPPPPAVSATPQAQTPPPRQTAATETAPPVAAAPPPDDQAHSETSVAHRRQVPVKRRSAAPEQTEGPAPSVPAVAASTSLRVNGIALQDDPAESVAVINGALMKRGMAVGDMRVEEILQDRVRLSGPGGTVEVHLSR